MYIWFRKNSHSNTQCASNLGSLYTAVYLFFGQQDSFYELRLNIIQRNNTAELTSQLPNHTSDTWAPPDLTGQLFLQPTVCLESIFLSLTSGCCWRPRGCSTWWHLRHSRFWAALRGLVYQPRARVTCQHNICIVQGLLCLRSHRYRAVSGKASCFSNVFFSFNMCCFLLWNETSM